MASGAEPEFATSRLLTSTAYVEGVSTTNGRVESTEIGDGEVEKEGRMTISID